MAASLLDLQTTGDLHQHSSSSTSSGVLSSLPIPTQVIDCDDVKTRSRVEVGPDLRTGLHKTTTSIDFEEAKENDEPVIETTHPNTSTLRCLHVIARLAEASSRSRHFLESWYCIEDATCTTTINTPTVPRLYSSVAHAGHFIQILVPQSVCSSHLLPYVLVPPDVVSLL